MDSHVHLSSLLCGFHSNETSEKPHAQAFMSDFCKVPCSLSHTLSFKALTANALTMVRAGFAFTTTSFPKAILLPAFCAGLWRVFTMHTPGIVNLPVDFTSLLTKVARASSTLLASDFFISQEVPRASAMAPFDKALAPFIAFIAFIGAMV